MKRLAVAMAATAALAALAAGVVSARSGSAQQARGKGNPFGITVVRFAKGTSAAQMANAVTAAGGSLVTDLGKIGAASAAPGAQGTAAFVARVKAQKGVTAAFEDKVVVRNAPDASQADGGITGSNDPALGSPGASGPTDPWHDAASWWGESNPEGVLQWDDNRNGARGAWATTTGDRTVRVAVIDSGVQGSHKEILPNYDNQTSANTIPCSSLVKEYGAAIVNAYGLKDCSSEDTDGHGTWVASRIAGAVNGFASNGIAPNVQVVGYKALATGFGGLTSWIVAAMVDACSHDVDLINMSLGGYDDPVAEADDYLLWVDGVNYCRSQGTAIVASAGNEHVRVNRVNMTIGGRALTGVGLVDAGNEGIASVLPGTTSFSRYAEDLRGLVETPAGVPGVIMVSSTNNAIGAGAPATGNEWAPALAGTRNQLTYYSSYGSRIDVAAPGGARKFNIPRYDGGPGDILYGGWGELGALDPSGDICKTLGSPLTFACVKVNGAGFGWLQGTSMSAPNATGVAALTLSAHHELQGNPDGLLARLKSTARTSQVNLMGPNDPANTSPSFFGVPCPTGFCHVDRAHPIAFADAYGAGIVNAAAAVQP